MDPRGPDTLALFDAAYYRAARPDLVGSDDDLRAHFLAHGWREGTSAHPLFDPAFYTAQHAVEGNPLLHYASTGWRMGLRPHPLFDPVFYAAQDPAPDDEPLARYCRTGWLRGFAPHRLFDPAHFRASHPAPLPQPDLIDYLIQSQGPDGVGAEAHPLIPERWYRETHLGGAPAAAALHYARDGWQAGLPPHPYFDVAHYRAQDREGSGQPIVSDLEHYLRVGEAAGLRPNPAFSPVFYRGTYGDLLEGGSALLHYVQDGEQRGLATSAEFRGNRYEKRHLATSPGTRPMKHFLQTGRRHGATVPPPLTPPLAATIRALRPGPGPDHVTVVLLAPSDPEARGCMLQEAECLVCKDVAALCRLSLPERPVILLSSGAFMAAADLARLAAAAQSGAAHPMVLDRAGDVWHAGYEPGAAFVSPRHPGGDPGHWALTAARDGLVTPGPALALPSPASLAALTPEMTVEQAFRTLSASSRFVPAAQAFKLDVAVGGWPAAPAGWRHPRPPRREQVLFIDSIVPREGHDAGSTHVMQLMAMHQESGAEITLLPDFDLAADPAAVAAVAARGVAVVQAPFAADGPAFIAGTPDRFDTVVLLRVDSGGRHMEALRARFPAARLVFHPGDLHHLREFRQAVQGGDATLFRQAIQTRHRELTVARQSDATVVVSQHELDLLRDHDAGARAIRIDPAYDNREPAPYDPHLRQHVAFIGGFRHLPNVDAVEFLCRHVWPRVIAAQPGLKLIVIGSHPPDHFQALASAGVEIRGRVMDLDAALDTLRFTVAPLRYGAGVKMKLVTSLAAGVPVLCSSVAAEGLELQPGQGLVLADGAEAFAREVVALYDDPDRLAALSIAGKAAAARFSPETVRAAYCAAILTPGAPA